MSERWLVARNGLLCSVIFVACLAIAHPVAQMGFVDDWSYIQSALLLSQTGHFVYNGWSSAMLGWQLLWGALFIKLFGFSFNVVKLSTVPIAAATVFLFHVIQGRFGIHGRNAILGTLTLALSPLFLPLSASYMTDVPGLFTVLLCLYGCQRALVGRTNAAALAWLCAATACSLIGGTARQTSWLGALVIVPCTAWLLRRRRWVVPAAIALWIASLAAVLFCLHWFGRQPYSTTESGFLATALHHPGRELLSAWPEMLGELLCLLLLVYPILVAWLGEIRRLRAADLAAFGSILLVVALLQREMQWTLPWVPHLILCEFSSPRTTDIGWDYGAFLLPMTVRYALALLVIGTALAGCFGFAMRRRAARSEGSRFPPAAVALLVPFTLSYCALIVPRAADFVAFDRYMLDLMPVAIVFLILIYQQDFQPQLPRSSAVAVALFAVLAVAGTHDWFAWQRARLAAIAELRAAAIPRTAIQGGFEYDGWTQIENRGHINDSRIRIPSGAYDPHPPLPNAPSGCRLDFAPYTPAVQPRYSVAFAGTACLDPSPYPPVRFRTWLPPFHGTIEVRAFPASEQRPDTAVPAPAAAR